jgi:hypothetical protein
MAREIQETSEQSKADLWRRKNDARRVSVSEKDA